MADALTGALVGSNGEVMGKLMGLIAKAEERQAQVDAENAQFKKGQLEMEAIKHFSRFHPQSQSRTRRL